MPTELIKAAILEPYVNTNESVPADNNSIPQGSGSNINNNQSIENIDLKILGVYGNDQINLVASQNECFIAIPGRYRPNMITSLIIYIPDLPDDIFIFSRITQMYNVIKFFNWLNETKNIKNLDSKSLIYYDNQWQPLTIISVNNVKQPVYVYVHKDIAYDLIYLNSITGEFYDYLPQDGMTAINFGLDGFKEALEGYDTYCKKN